MERPTSPPVPEGNDPFEPLSSKLPPPKTTVDTPPSTPAAELGSPNTSAASNTIEKMPDVAMSEPLRTLVPAAESDSDLEDGEIGEYDRSATSGADSAAKTKCAGAHMAVTVEQSYINAKAASLHVVAAKDEEEGEDEVSVDLPAPDKINAKAVGKETRESEPEGLSSTDTEDLLAAMQKPTIAPEAGSSDGEEEHLEAADGTQSSGVGEKEMTADESEDGSFKDDEDNAAETHMHKDTANAPSRSVPPHMRPAFKAPNAHSGALEGRVGYFDPPQRSYANARQLHWPAPVPRAPRSYFPPVGHQPSRPPLDFDELQRTKAQLIKARSDLDVERKVNAEMRKTVGAEKQASIGAAMANMLSDLLQKQADALTAKAKTQEKERDLQYREQRITQLETYLSNGQKQLKWQLEQRGIRAMSEVDEAHLRREVELKMKHQLSDIEGKIGIQVERLRHQEAAQKIREQQYKALIRDALENESREQLAHDMQAKTGDAKFAEEAYERGLSDGKKSGVTKGSEAELKQEFLQGYAACYRTLTALHNVRNGKIAVDSPEVASLFDPTHPENPHNVGLDIGRMEAAAAKTESTVGVVISRRSMEEGATMAAAVQGKPEAPANAVTHRGRGQALSSNAGPSRSWQPVSDPEQMRPTQQAPPNQAREVQQMQQAQQEHPARR